ncbi:MAG: GHMP kinase, partial [Thermoplasmata archaeon]|nr:GHMP kinase [Thermoplasmata archaeon]
MLDEGWHLKMQFTAGMSHDQIDSFFRHARDAGALGGKLVGSGGGGYILLFCDFERRANVAKAV